MLRLMQSTSITKTSTCNIQKFCSSVKLEHFIDKCLIFFIYFCSKHTYIVGTQTDSSGSSVHTINVLSKNFKNINFFLMKFSIFTVEKIIVYCTDNSKMHGNKAIPFFTRIRLYHFSHEKVKKVNKCNL